MKSSRCWINEACVCIFTCVKYSINEANFRMRSCHSQTLKSEEVPIEVGFGRGPAETRVEGVISLRHCRGTPPSPRHAPEEERERGRREGCQGCQVCSNEGVHRPVRVDPLHAAATVRPRDQSLTTEDSECSLVYVPDDADPRRPPSPKHRTQHSKYELNDMRRRCEEL